MRPFVIPVSVLIALALLGAGGQSVARAATPLHTPEPLERSVLADGPATPALSVVTAPAPYALHTPEPLLAAPKPAHHAPFRPITMALPGDKRVKGVTLTNGAIVYNLVFPMVGTPGADEDVTVKLLNQPNTNQVEVTLTTSPRVGR